MLHADHIARLLHQDPLRMQVLALMARYGPPGSYAAAGFVRNLIWDHLHNKAAPTPLNDVDVIYYDPTEDDPNRFADYEAELTRHLPDVNWQVRNQAKMHERNGDPPYTDIVDAMGYWPEQETTIAVRLTGSGAIDCISAFGLDSLFALQVTHNPKRDAAIFQDRIQRKGWLHTWPKLTVLASS